MPKGFVLISDTADLRIVQISTVSENGFTATCMLTPIVSLFPFSYHSSRIGKMQIQTARLTKFRQKHFIF